MKFMFVLLFFSSMLFSVNITPAQMQMLKDAGYTKSINSAPSNEYIQKEQIVENEIVDDKDTNKEANKEATLEIKEPKLTRYGSLFFNNKNKINPYSIPTPANYTLNYGDKLRLTVYGATTQKFDLFVNKDGNITIPQVGELKVIGNSFEDTKKSIIEQSRKAYPNSTSILLDIAEFTSIQVTISGLVNAPGLYNLASFSTIKDALVTSGGILENGSYRTILLKRAGKIYKTFDLYSLVRFGDSSSDVILQNGDILLIKPIIKEIKLTGAVNYNAIFELKSDEEFIDLFDYAAGFKARANKKAIKLKRYENNTVKVYTLSLKDLRNFEPKDGDSVHVYSTSTIAANLVQINGNIVAQGEKELPMDAKLSTLLKNELEQFGNNSYFKDDTNYNFAVIKNDNNIKTFNLQNVLEQKEELFLSRGDIITIFKNDELKEKSYIYASGSIVDNTKRKYDFYDGMQVSDLFNLVKFKTDDIVDDKRLSLSVDKTKVQITRIEDYKKSTFLININENSTFKLKKYDDIRFFEYSQINDTFKATIKGEVFLPGTYDIGQNSTINDIVNLSGGFTKKALYSRFEIARYEIKNSKRIRTIKTMNVNDALNQNIKINADDEITIFPIANWNEKIYVTIDGRVRFPGTYAIEEGEKLASIIERAGGFMDNAFIEGSIFTREEIRILQQERLDKSIEKLQTQVTQDALNADEAGSNKDEKLKMLSTVKLLEKEAKKNSPLGRISLSLYYDIKRFKDSPYNITLKDKDKLYIPSVNDTVSVLGEVLNQNTFVYEKDLDTNDYLSKAGGITDVADEDYIYIVKANGETKKFKGSYFFGGGNEIFKGDTIVVPLKVDTFSDMRFAKDVSTILYQFAVTAASLKTVGGI